MNEIINYIAKTCNDNPENLNLVCEYIFHSKLDGNCREAIKQLWSKKYPLLVSDDVTRNDASHLLAVYSMLKALLTPRTKIVVMATSYRQSKIIFKYCEEIWLNSRDLKVLSGSGKARRDIDKCVMTLGQSSIIFIPVGNGDRIKRLNPDAIIIDSSHNVPDDFFKYVVTPFAPSQSNCQVILAGEVVGDYNHFSKYVKRYADIISSEGDYSVSSI